MAPEIPLRSDAELSKINLDEFLLKAQAIAQERWNKHLDGMYKLDCTILDKVSDVINDLKFQEHEGVKRDPNTKQALLVEGRRQKVCQCPTCSRGRERDARKAVELHNEITRDYDGGAVKYEIFRDGRHWDVKEIRKG